MVSPLTCAEDSMPFVIDMLMAEPVPMEMLLDDLMCVRIVYVGEVHTIARHHQIQKQILRKLAERKLNPALAMEMFSEEHQAVLDRWMRSKDDLSALIKDLGKERWTNLMDYQSVLTTARDLGVPIVALNAPDRLVRKVAREGLESLSTEDRKRLPAGFQDINPLNDRLLRLRLRIHKAFQEKSLDNIVLAQAIRDATMAQAVVRFLESAEGKDRIMMVVAGTGHVNYGFGIPERVKSVLDLPYRIILTSESGELVLSDEEMRQMVPVRITHEDLKFIPVPIADYLYVIPLREPSRGHPAEEQRPHQSGN
jgi:uncharacterized iron-regulated protein